MEVDSSTGEEVSGPYVAKVIPNRSVAKEATKAYSKVRGQTGAQALAGLLEVRESWEPNEITALLYWIEGESLDYWKGDLGLFSEEQDGRLSENQILSWLKRLCHGLEILHQCGLVHGDISLKNIILNYNTIPPVLTITDYDLSTKAGNKLLGTATSLYSGEKVERQEPVSYSDDFFALAAVMFHALFNKSPFEFVDLLDKSRGLNWESINKEAYPRVAQVLDKATNPDQRNRYKDAMEMGKHIDLLLDGNRPISEISLSEKLPVEPSEQVLPWLLNILQSYPASPKGNVETRGLDSDFARNTYVETELDRKLAEDIINGKVSLVILCGNAGDGKTAFIQNLADRIGKRINTSAERLWHHTLDNGTILRANLDGAAAYDGKSATELLEEFFAPFSKPEWNDKLVNIVAINDGPLLSWLQDQENNQENIWLRTQLSSAIEGANDFELDPRMRFIDLNARSLVGTITEDGKGFQTDFLNALLLKMIGPTEQWNRCESCTAKNRCTAWESYRALQLDSRKGRIREQLARMLRAVHQRGEIHITTRMLRATLSYIFFGYYYCQDLHDNPNIQTEHFWDRAFNHNSMFRQGDFLRELEQLDPALDAHPKIV